MQRVIERLSRNRMAIRVILIVYWCLMFAGTHMPKVPDALEQVSDKTLHFLAYCGLYVLLVIDAVARRRVSGKLLIGFAALCAVYGIVDELLQIPVGRSADVRDWLADMRGVLTGIVVVFVAGWFGGAFNRNAGDQRTEK